MFGRKIAVMREEPPVSFEVDETDGSSSRCVVVAEGLYEELFDRGYRVATLLLLAANDPVPRGLNGNGVHLIVAFGLRLTERADRFERRNA
jgi:hypothetical protein